MKKYKLVVCGGTFDHLHAGHKDFLQFAFSKSKKVIIGLTTDSFVDKEKKEKIELYNDRKAALTKFLQGKNFLQVSEIVPIESLHIPKSVENLPIEAIVATDESAKGAKIINQDRKSRNLPLLPIEVHKLLQGEDGKVISSDRIRNGKINRNGRPFINPVWLKQKLYLPESIRSKLKRPIGKQITNFSDFVQNNELDLDRTITVGDVATKSFRELNLVQRIAVFDFRVQREERYKNPEELGIKNPGKAVEVENPASTLTPELFKGVEAIFQTQESKTIALRIIGEEDLSVLVFVLYAPLDYHIFYGQPGDGVVDVKVDERIKEKVYNIVQKFSVSP